MFCEKLLTVGWSFEGIRSTVLLHDVLFYCVEMLGLADWLFGRFVVAAFGWREIEVFLGGWNLLLLWSVCGVTSGLDHWRLGLLSLVFLWLCKRGGLFFALGNLNLTFFSLFSFLALFTFELQFAKLLHLFQFQLVNLVASEGCSYKMKIILEILSTNFIIFVLILQDAIFNLSDYLLTWIDFIADELEERGHF